MSSTGTNSSTATSASKPKVSEAEAYCMKCKAFRKFKETETVAANNKSSSIKKGLCESCNGKVSRIVSNKSQ